MGDLRTARRLRLRLRLDGAETEALRKRAERKGRSTQGVARQRVRGEIERTSRRELLDRVVDAEYPATPKRWGDSAIDAAARARARRSAS
jgi:hypothetical protein